LNRSFHIFVLEQTLEDFFQRKEEGVICLKFIFFPPPPPQKMNCVFENKEQHLFHEKKDFLIKLRRRKRNSNKKLVKTHTKMESLTLTIFALSEAI
jgi:hypothetical protein